MRVTAATGRLVFANKDALKALGFKWFRSGDRKGWVIQPSNVTGSLMTAVTAMGAGVALVDFEMSEAEVSQTFRASRAGSRPAPTPAPEESGRTPVWSTPAPTLVEEIIAAPVSAPVAPAAAVAPMPAPAATGSVAALEEALARARAAEAAAALPDIATIRGPAIDLGEARAQVAALKSSALNFLAALESLERKLVG